MADLGTEINKKLVDLFNGLVISAGAVAGNETAIQVQTMLEKHGEPFREFRNTYIAQNLGPSLSPLIGGKADDVLGSLKTVDKMAESNPELFKQLNIILDTPGSVDFLQEAAKDDALKQKLQTVLDGSDPQGGKAFLTALAEKASADKNFFIGLKEGKIFERGGFTEEGLKDPVKALDLLADVSKAAMVETRLRQYEGYEEFQNARGTGAGRALGAIIGNTSYEQSALKLEGLASQDKDVFNKINRLMSLEGAEKFMKIAAEDPHLSGMFKTLLGDPDADATAGKQVIDLLYDEAGKNPKLFTQINEFAEQQPELFAQSTEGFVNDPKGTMEKLKAMQAQKDQFKNFLGSLNLSPDTVEGITNFLGSVASKIGQFFEACGIKGFGSMITNALGDMKNMIGVGNNDGKLAQAAGADVQQKFDSKGNPVVNPPEPGQERKYAGGNPAAFNVV